MRGGRAAWTEHLQGHVRYHEGNLEYMKGEEGMKYSTAEEISAEEEKVEVLKERLKDVKSEPRTAREVTDKRREGVVAFT